MPKHQIATATQVGHRPVFGETPTQNRALQFTTANFATHNDSNGSTSLAGADWELELRVRPDAAAAYYAFMRDNLTTGANEEFAVIYGFTANTFELYCTSGHFVRLALASQTPPGAFYLILFKLLGTTLYAYLNGVLSASTTVAQPLAAEAVAKMMFNGTAIQNSRGAITFDYVKITRDNELTVHYAFDETTGTYANAGSAGGQLVLSNPAPTSLEL